MDMLLMDFFNGLDMGLMQILGHFLVVFLIVIHNL